MDNRRLLQWLGGLGLVALLIGAGMWLFFPAYIQGLLAQPDGSYLCKWLLRHQLKNPQQYTAEYYANYIPQVIVRILWLGYLSAAGVLLILTKGRRYWTDFWNHTETAFNMGVFRISLMGIFFIFDLSPLNNLFELSPEGVTPPFGYGFVRDLMPFPSGLILGLWRAYDVLVVLVAVGLLTRLTVPLLTLVSFFVLLGPQLVGKMNHYHHIWIALFLLNFTRSGDALSIDWIIRRLRGDRSDVHRYDQLYGRTFVYLWLMMGAIYYFPGFWKFAAGGFDWAFTDNVQLKILAKIYETGEQPVIPLYNYPLLCQLGGAATLILELAFPFAMIFPKTRLLFAFGGILFHEGNRRITQIGFTSIEFLYPSFIDWSALLLRRSLFRSDTGTLKLFRPPRWQTVTSVVMVGLVYVMGIIAFETWPWALYPTFAPLEQKFVNSIEMRVRQGEGEPRAILLQEDPTLIAAYNNRTRLRSFMTMVMMETRELERDQMLRSLFDLWRRDHPEETVQGVEFWQVQVPLLPLGAPPVPYKLLGKL